MKVNYRELTDLNELDSIVTEMIQYYRQHPFDYWKFKDEILEKAPKDPDAHCNIEKVGEMLRVRHADQHPLPQQQEILAKYNRYVRIGVFHLQLCYYEIPTPADIRERVGTDKICQITVVENFQFPLSDDQKGGLLYYFVRPETNPDPDELSLFPTPPHVLVAIMPLRPKERNDDEKVTDDGSDGSFKRHDDKPFSHYRAHPEPFPSDS